MLAIVRSTPGLCASARAISPAPRRPGARPIALAGARVTRAREDRVETVERAIVVFDVALSGLAASERCCATIDDAHASEPVVDFALDRFGDALEQMRAMTIVALDVRRANELIDRARPAVERRARHVLSDAIRRRITSAQERRDRAIEYALDCVDEAPAAQRTAVAQAGSQVVAKTIVAHAPVLYIAPIALLHLSIERRASEWRLSCDARFATLSWKTYADATRDGAICALCCAVRRRFTVCARCGEPRCDGCSRYCGGCRRWSCASCAKGARCPSCGADGLVGDEL